MRTRSLLTGRRLYSGRRAKQLQQRAADSAARGFTAAKISRTRSITTSLTALPPMPELHRRDRLHQRCVIVLHVPHFRINRERHHGIRRERL